MTKEDWINEWNIPRFNEFGECVGSISELFAENQNLHEVRKSELQLYRRLKAENKLLRETLETIARGEGKHGTFTCEQMMNIAKCTLTGDWI